jgi:hypothetical protein
MDRGQKHLQNTVDRHNARNQRRGAATVSWHFVLATWRFPTSFFPHPYTAVKGKMMGDTEIKGPGLATRIPELLVPGMSVNGMTGGTGSGVRRPGLPPKFSKSRAPLLLPALLVTAMACSPSAPRNDAEQKDISPHNTLFPFTLGHTRIQVELAVSTEEMRRGLMFRSSLDDDTGMLFVYAAPRRLSFWMRNTQIPLDIAYFDRAGIIQEIHRMYPNSESSVPSASEQVQFALEMNQGWFTKNGVASGQQLDLSALTAALSARGFEPENFGLSAPGGP